MSQPLPRTAYKLREVAQRSGKSVPTLYREHSRGNLKFIKIGKSTLVTAEEEARWLREAGQDAQAETPPTRRRIAKGSRK